MNDNIMFEDLFIICGSTHPWWLSCNVYDGFQPPLKKLAVTPWSGHCPSADCMLAVVSVQEPRCPTQLGCKCCCLAYTGPESAQNTNFWTNRQMYTQRDYYIRLQHSLVSLCCIGPELTLHIVDYYCCHRSHWEKMQQSSGQILQCNTGNCSLTHDTHQKIQLL